MGFSGDSDQVPFEENNIPNVMFIYRPLDPVYHTPADTPEHISRNKILDTGRLTALIVLKATQADITEVSQGATTSSTTSTVSVTSEVQTYPAATVILVIVAGVILLLWKRRRR
jgi:hypothetical protein